MEVWIEENGRKSFWGVQSKKDNSLGGGCFNCKGLLGGERRNINFNHVKWGILENMFDKSEISQETFMEISISGNEGKKDGEGGGDTPPILPPRASTPVSEGATVGGGVIRYPPILPPPYPARSRSRMRKHFT